MEANKDAKNTIVLELTPQQIETLFWGCYHQYQDCMHAEAAVMAKIGHSFLESRGPILLKELRKLTDLMDYLEASVDFSFSDMRMGEEL